MGRGLSCSPIASSLYMYYKKSYLHFLFHCYSNADLSVLESILHLVQKAREDETGRQTDDKLRQIKAQLSGPLKGQKVLLFTSFHDTATYLYQQLSNDSAWQAQAGQPVLGLISGDTKPDERRKLIERFAPIANRPPELPGDQPWRPDGQEMQLLISTDVLSEGQNLQDAGVVINYDLHWNPVRLIQRAGRVDRIGSPFAEIALYNVFPEAELESLLGLVQRLAARIAQIDQTVGLDASVLGEVISQRSLEQLRQLHHKDQRVLHDLERQAELVSTEEMKFPLVSYIQQIGERVVAELPMGIHSGKHYVARDGRPGTFLAFRAGERHFWRFYPDDGSEPEKSVRAIYAMIACAREEARIEPGPVPMNCWSARRGRCWRLYVGSRPGVALVQPCRAWRRSSTTGSTARRSGRGTTRSTRSSCAASMEC